MQLWQQVAESWRLFAFTYAQHRVVRRFHLIVRHDDAAYAALTGFDSADGGTFFVQQVRGNRHRHNGVHFLGVLFQRFFFNQTQNGERQGFVVTDGTCTATARADVMARFTQRRAQTLAGHLQQAEAGDVANLDTCTILTYRFTQTVFNRALVANRGHVDKVDNDQAAEVAQTQLTGNLICRFEVGVERRLFNVAAAGCASGVDVDGGQRFGAVDNNRAAGRQTHFTLEGGFDLRLNLVVAEQRDFTGVELNFAAEIRTAQRGDMLASQLQHFRVINQDFANVLAQIVTESANDNVALLVNQEWSRAALCGFLNRFPVFQAEAEIPLQRFGRFANACGTHDKTHAVRQFEARQRLFQLGTVIAFDTAGDAARTRVVRHQNEVATGEADKGSQRRAFVAALFFVDLDDHFLAFTQDIFDVRTAMRVVVGGEVFASDLFEGEETVTFSAVVNEGSFKARFNAGDFTFVDIGFFLFMPGAFDIQVVQTLPINKCDTQLFLLSCVD